MRQKWLFALPLLLLISCSGVTPEASSFSSGASSASTPVSNVRVIIEEGEHFHASSNILEVPRGSDATVELTFEPRFTIQEVDYENAYFVETKEHVFTLTLPNVRFPARVHVTEMEIEQQIWLHLNGGSFLPGKGEGDRYRYYADSSHLRPVLPVGIDRMKRDGYTLIGWNTKPDGTGIEVGLGSRFEWDKEQETVDFYAMWEEQTRLGYFRFVTEDDKITLRSYTGPSEIDALVLPSFIGDKPVTRVSSYCFDSVKTKKLVLPLTLQTLDEGAFLEVEAEDLYFYDCLSEVSDESFSSCSFGFTHILLREPARGARYTPNTQWSENVDRLASLRNEKKIIYFSGCTGSYCMISPEVEKALGYEYHVINMGLLGDTNSTVMFDNILPYLGEGDILIHAPEEMSVYSLLGDLSCETCFFELFQGNFDLLLDTPHVTDLPNFFRSFAAYRQIQDNEPYGSYSDRCIYYDEYGDCCVPRNNQEDPTIDRGLELAYGTQYLVPETCARLNSYYDKVREKGATPVFSYGPINKNVIDRLDPLRSAQRSFDDAVHRLLRIDVISDIVTSEFEGIYTFDTDYHLTEEGARIRTASLIEDLKAYLGLDF